MNGYLILIIVVILTLLPLFISWNARHEINIKEFRAAPSSFSGLVIVFSILGTVIGGAMFIAVGQIGFEAGVVGFILGFVYLFSFTFFGFSATRIVKFMEDTGQDTLADLIEYNYSKRVSFLFSLVNAFMYIFLLASQCVIVLTFFNFFSGKGLSEVHLYIIIATALLAVGCYTQIGGIQHDIRTDVIQVIIISGATCLIIWLILNQTSVSDVMSSLPDAHLTGGGYGWVYTAALFVFIGPMIFVRPDIWQRAVALRDKSQTVLVFFAGGFFSMMAFMIFTFLGMWAKVSFPGSAASAATLEAIWSLTTAKNDLIFAAILGGLFAAILSSADTLINNSAIHLERLIPGRFRANEGDEKRELRVLQIISFLVIGISIVIGLAVSDVVNLITASFSILLIFLPTIIGIVTRGDTNEQGAFWSVSISLVIFLLTLQFAGIPKVAFVPAALASWLIYGGFSLKRRFWSQQWG